MHRRQSLIIASLIVMFSVIPGYKIKTKLGVDLLPGPHTPNLVEELTGRLIKARWVDRNYFRRPDFRRSNIN